MTWLLPVIWAVQETEPGLVDGFTMTGLAQGATIIGMFGAAGALFYAALQVNLLREQLQLRAEAEKKQRTFSFMQRWNEPVFDAKRASVATFLRTKPTADEITRKREDDAGFRRDLNLVINFFEELGIVWNRAEINHELMFSFFGGVVIGYWDWLDTFVAEHRKQQVGARHTIDQKVLKGIWQEFEEMHTDVKRRLDDLGKA